MKGDFTRDTFNPAYHFTRVLMQQGRVQVDADWNEMTSIFWHYLRRLTIDLIGPHAGPAGTGFEVLADGNDDLTIGRGSYYVHGLRCENEADPALSYEAQPGYPFPDSLTVDQVDQGIVYVAYLEAWERHVTSLDMPAIREVALGDVDTATRSQVVWQLKLGAYDLDEDGADMTIQERLVDLHYKQDNVPPNPSWPRVKALGEIAVASLDLSTRAAEWLALRHPALTHVHLAASSPGSGEGDVPCVVSPASGFRGLENQLYRVEIHAVGDDGTAYYKWSRNNGSVVAEWLDVGTGHTLIVSRLRGAPQQFVPGQWVELTDLQRELRGQPGTMVRLVKVEDEVLTYEPNSVAGGVEWSPTLQQPRVRGWDHTVGLNGEPRGVLPIPPLNETHPLDLEDGIQIRFTAPEGDMPASFNAGDYWLIAARTATGRVEWPEAVTGDALVPVPQPPHGTEHFFAPLALVVRGQAGDLEVTDLRRRIRELWEFTTADDL